ncbi:MAG: ABC transporter ATP-binding protein [Candidatus Aminicenantes bacterium]|nr:ABC transporter ATP-binding protein [Candidatus Aminicenantes bacterium]
MSEIVRAVGLGKEYPLPKGTLRVFSGLEFCLEEGETAAVMGVSGVGKTTFLNLLGALDRPSEGTVRLEEVDLFSLGSRELAKVRNRKIGFVFQFFHLLPEFTSMENVAIPALMAGFPREKAMARAAAVLAEVGLEDRASFRPAQLSGGEMQRVAIARALANEPLLLLADEPTGNLDWKTGELVLRLLADLQARRGFAAVLVTHNEKVAAFCRKTYLMERGDLKRLA